ncbi:uncharacterized protein LOC128188551 isoform X6 [Crassostrea angulata]|uniref:uncharacterized protein LOC128188551 isoform X6 n=1 Tax=Magallana angulata TaxID=2784310 RepID=UPI0022B0BA54|nr:uncharacterized protein LOC128188551 isoform X6 [Crassostrea angulata]
MDAFEQVLYQNLGKQNDFQATERIFRKVVHPGLDSLRLVDKNGVPINTPLSSMKQKMFILSPRGVPTRVTNHAYSGQPMRMSRPYSEGLSRLEVPEYNNENLYEQPTYYRTTKSVVPYSTKRSANQSKGGLVKSNKSKSASSRGYLSSVADEKRFLQSANSSQSSRWNTSGQGLRLEKEWTDLANSRSLKRNSEIVTHRVDRMYFMTGNSINLKPKYHVDEEELHRLREISKSRQSSRRQNRVIHMPACSSQHSKKVQHHSQLEEDLQALTVKEGNTEKNENDNAENSGENVERPKSPLGGWSLTENPAPEPDQKEALSRLSLHKDDNPEVPPSEGGNSERDNMTNGEDDGFHEEEVDMKGRADGRQGVEDVIEPNTDDAIPEESANNTVEEEP